MFDMAAVRNGRKLKNTDECKTSLGTPVKIEHHEILWH
jgi:hypothetical protein